VKKKVKQKVALDAFKQMLEEPPNFEFKTITTYDDFVKRFNEDARFHAVDKKERENIFSERMQPLIQAEEEKRKEQKLKLKNDFIEMLKENKNIKNGVRWSKVKHDFEEDKRYKAILSSHEREDIFNEYMKELEKDDEEEKKKKKERAEREERSKREREKEVRKLKERELREVEKNSPKTTFRRSYCPI